MGKQFSNQFDMAQEIERLEKENALINDELMHLMEKHVAPLDIENIQLKKENERLEKQLKEAEVVIEFYADKNSVGYNTQKARKYQEDFNG